MVFPVRKKIAVLMALLCSLISASQLTYLLINLHSTFYYRGRQRLAQIFTSSGQTKNSGSAEKTKKTLDKTRKDPCLVG